MGNLKKPLSVAMTTKEAKEIKANWSGRGHKYSQEEIELVARVMQEADPLTQGCYQAEFEKKFAEFVESPHAFAVSSCTAALELSAILCRLAPQDEVILPAHTFAATAIPFGRTGARLCWADIDPETFLITAETIRPLLSEHTRAIVVVHLYGLACDMDPILDLIETENRRRPEDKKIRLIEDAAQAPGARYKGRPVGSIGDFGCFSFHTHKNMTTLGEGGALAVREKGEADLVPGLRHNGMRAYTHEREHYWQPAMSDVDFDIEGFWPYNFCIGEVQCALATKLLERLVEMNEARRKKAVHFRREMQDFPELVFQKVPEGCGHAHHLLPAFYDGKETKKTRDDLMRILAYELGIKVVVQYYPLYRYPMFQKAGFGEANCPNTDRFFDNMLSFPFHHWQSEEEFLYMIEATKKALTELREK